MANTPAFSSTPKNANVQLATADTAYVNPVTAQLTIFTAPATGAKVFVIDVIQAQDTSVTASVRIFIGATSTTGKLVDNILLTGATGSTTTIGGRTTRFYDNFIVGPSQLLIATTAVTAAISVTAHYAEF